MISRETISVAADTVRKAYESEDVDRAIDLLESIIRMVPDENEDDSSPQQKAQAGGKVSRRSLHSTGPGQNKTQKEGLSEPCSSEDLSGSISDDGSDREGVSDTSQLSKKPVQAARDNVNGRSEGRSVVLTDNQKKAYEIIINAPEEGLPTSIIVNKLGFTSEAIPRITGWLKALEKKGFIYQKGSGRGSVWKKGRRP